MSIIYIYYIKNKKWFPFKKTLKIKGFHLLCIRYHLLMRKPSLFLYCSRINPFSVHRISQIPSFDRFFPCIPDFTWILETKPPPSKPYSSAYSLFHVSSLTLNTNHGHINHTTIQPSHHHDRYTTTTPTADQHVHRLQIRNCHWYHLHLLLIASVGYLKKP